VSVESNSWGHIVVLKCPFTKSCFFIYFWGVLEYAFMLDCSKNTIIFHIFYIITAPLSHICLERIQRGETLLQFDNKDGI